MTKTVVLRQRPAQCGNPKLDFVEPAPRGEDRALSPDQKSFHACSTTANRGRKWWSPGSIPFHTVRKLQRRLLIADLAGVRGASAPGEDRFHPRIINPSIHVQLRRIGDENGGPPGPYRPARCGNSISGHAICGLALAVSAQWGEEDSVKLHQPRSSRPTINYQV